MKWHWEKVDVSRSGTAGDVSKLFKNEAIKAPGILAVGVPPADETILAREVVQNSWDAARELAAELQAADEEPPEFLLEFAFRDVSGGEREACIETLGLHELVGRVDDLEAGASEESDPQRPKAVAQLGLPSRKPIDALAKPQGSLRLLEIRESGTTGMYGPFSGTSSKLYLALVSIGFTAKAAGSGGSFGYGKAGLVRGSSTRTVVAYTCFRERADDPGVTRRLLGMTYWGRHELDGASFTGFGRFGDATAPSGPIPFENEEADAIAEALGLDVRDAAEVEDLGTSFLVVEPTIEARPLCEALERNWWPALVSGAFDIDVFTAGGKHMVPRPRANPELLPFVRSYELATVAQDSDVAHEWSKRFRRFTARSGTVYDLGALGVVADVDDGGWSYPRASASSEVRHRSLVALVRSPRMVVEYLECGSVMPFVRGTLVASDEVDDKLRQTEPKGHDSWQIQGDLGDVDPDAPEIAAAVITRLRQQVSVFRRGLKPPSTERRGLRLPVLEGLFNHVLDGGGNRSALPAPARRPVSIELSPQQLRMAGLGIQVAGAVAVGLADHIEAPSLEVEVRMRYLFLEDGRTGESCGVAIDPPRGFAESPDRPGAFVGLLGHETVAFTFETDSYDSNWSGKLAVTAELTGAQVSG